MSKNLVTKSFKVDGSWTCPSGVKQVRLRVIGHASPPIASANNPEIAFAISERGTLFGWGNGNIQGDNVLSARSSPGLVIGAWSVRSVATASDAAFALLGDGTLVSWGSNSGQGVLGNNAGGSHTTAQRVFGSRFYKALTGMSGEQPSVTGHGTGMAIDASGDTYAWGVNAHGQLGDGTTVSKSTPTLVLGGLKFVQIVGGQATGGGLLEDGTMYTWGHNTFYTVGDGTNVPKSSPVLVAGGLKFTSISMGTYNAAGITADGTLYMWGANSFGQCGNGTVVAPSTPTQVIGATKWKSVAANGSFTQAIDVDGNMWSWGTNVHGQLGDGTVVAKSSPVLVLGALKWAMAKGSGMLGSSGGLSNPGTAFGLTQQGALYSWGAGTDGILGDGTTTVKSSPVLVLGGITWRTVLDVCLTELVVPVTPGATYPVTLNAPALVFGNQVVFQSANGEVQATMVLEYQS